MKPLVIYHANCADGFGAAFAAWLKFGDEAEYVPFNYGEVKEDYIDLLSKLEVANGSSKSLVRGVYILDLSFSKKVMNYIFNTAKYVVWLDHHKTAFEIWKPELVSTQTNYISEEDGYEHIELSWNKSGAMLAWEYFHPNKEVPLLIKHIDDYDRWQFKTEGTKEFNKALWSYVPWSFEQWKNRFYNDNEEWGHPKLKLGSDSYKKLLCEGAALLRAHEQNVMAVVKGCARKCKLSKCTKWHHDSELAGDACILEGLAANCPPHLASDVGHELANQSGTYGLLWYINKEGKCLCSLRSNADYDVSSIAQAFGGGGHKNAAGFEVDIQILLEWIK